MTEEERMTAWNNLVMNAHDFAFAPGDKRRAAAIASIYMGSANNGGLCFFLSQSNDLDAQEVLASLEVIGANVAAVQLRHVLDVLGEPLPATTQELRWKQINELWTDRLNAFETLTDEADMDLVAALEKHVDEFSEYYLSMTSDDLND